MGRPRSRRGARSCPAGGRHTLLGVRRRFRAAVLALLAALPLAGGVGRPGGDPRRLGEGLEIVRTPGAECGRGWEELPEGSQRPRVIDPKGFSLLSWNAYKGRGTRWARDFESLVADRDLVLLQEAHLTPAFRAALNVPGLRWLMVPAFDYAGTETGVLTAGRVRASAACFSRTAEPLIRLPKSALLTRYRLGDAAGELWVVNLHGVNFTLGTARFRSQIEALARVVSPHRGPLILAGDFNDWSRAREEIVQGFARELGLTDLDLPPEMRSRHLGATVDHVFYRGLDPIAAKSIEVESSDHHPILARFRLSGEGGKGERE